MHHSRPLILASVVAAAAFALLAAGCGGGISPGANGSSSATATTTQNGTRASALAFARCMRSHGLPKWPDPTYGGVFDKLTLQHTGYTVAQVRSVQDGPCNHLLRGAAPQAPPTITPAEQADYLKATACMRSHGFPRFPDPTFPNNNIHINVPSSINQDSSTFKSAAEVCVKLIPAGLPYSSSAAR
jgi:hypothetical protein